MNPLTVCFCHPILSIISARVAPFLRWSMATTWDVLLPSRGCGFLRLGGSFALGRILGGSGLLGGLALRGRTLGQLGGTFGLTFGFRLSGQCRLRCHGLAQILDALPNPRSGRGPILELLDRRNARKAVPNGHQP